MKKLGGLSLLLLLAAGVWVNNLRPAPSKKARKAVGVKTAFNPIVSERVGDLTVEYYSSGEGPRVVLIASAGREASDFNELVAELNREGYRTLTVEHMGIGQTTLIDPHDPFFLIANTLENDGFLNDDLPYFYVGHAYGNRIVRLMATLFTSEKIRKPNLSGIILLAAGGQVPPDPEADAALKRVFNPFKSYRSRIKDVRTAFFADGNEIPQHWKRGWHTKTAIAQGKNKGDGDDSWHCAGGVPMLIVQPMQDKIAPPENAYALKEKCSQEVEIFEVQNAGHALLPEQPEAVAKAVLDFLTKHHPTETNK